MDIEPYIAVKNNSQTRSDQKCFLCDEPCLEENQVVTRSEVNICETMAQCTKEHQLQLAI